MIGRKRPSIKFQDVPSGTLTGPKRKLEISNMTQEEIQAFIKMIKEFDPSKREGAWEYGEYYDGWYEAIEWVSTKLESEMDHRSSLRPMHMKSIKAE